MSSEAGTSARWWVARTVSALDTISRGHQQPLEHLERLRHAREALDTATSFMVDAARTEGASWADIGRAMGISRQAARQAEARRQQLDAARTEAKAWNMPLPVHRPRARWFPRRAAS